MRGRAEGERLQKVLAAAGIGSRRFCEQLITGGRVTVDGEVAELGQKINPSTAEVRVDGERVNVNPELVYVMLNKPRGVVTTARDLHGRRTVLDLVNLRQRLFPVGRLDMDSEGLLLLTNDGPLAHALTHPSYEVERTYLAQVSGRPSRRQLAQLREGVQLEDGLARAKSAQIVGEARQRSLVKIVMTEGRKREVRRMLDAVGFPVERLARVTHGGVELGDLRLGRWRPLSQQEVARLYAAVQVSGRPPPRTRITRDDRATRRRGDTSIKRHVC